MRKRFRVLHGLLEPLGTSIAIFGNCFVVWLTRNYYLDTYQDLSTLLAIHDQGHVYKIDCNCYLDT